MFGLPATTLIPAVLVFLAVAFGTISLALLIDIMQERRRRLSALQSLREFANSPGGADGPGLLRGKRPTSPAGSHPWRRGCRPSRTPSSCSSRRAPR